MSFPHAVVRVLPGLALTVGAVVCFANGLLGLANLHYNAAQASMLAWNVIAPFASAAVLLSLVALPPPWRGVAALCVAAIAPGVYLAEATLTWQHRTTQEAQAGFDGRDKLTVLQDLRRQGTQAWPAVRPKSLLVDDEDGRLVSDLGPDGFLPLASLPQVTTVVCNEGGFWLIQDSDEHGFSNRPGAWATAGPGSVVLAGDSFTQGICVDREASIAGTLARVVPSVINIGISGFGPLSTLAAVKEYAEPLRPRVVVWLFFEGNDLTQDLPQEMRAPVLTAYLDPDHRGQGLFGRRDEITSRLRGFLDARLIEAVERYDDPLEPVFDFFALYHLRQRFGLDDRSIGLTGGDLDGHLATFRQVLARAKELTGSWGGRLVVAYLPESGRYYAAEHNAGVHNAMHIGVRDAARRLGLTVVDGTEVFARQDDPRRLFRYPGSHYNENGYRLIAEALAPALMAEQPSVARDQGR